MQDTPKRSRVQSPAFDKYRVMEAIDRAKGITQVECALLHALLRFSKPTDAAVWPSQETMARRMKTTRRTVWETIAALVERKILTERGVTKAGVKVLVFNAAAIEALAAVEKPKSGRGRHGNHAKPNSKRAECPTAPGSGRVARIPGRPTNDAQDGDDDDTGTDA